MNAKISENNKLLQIAVNQNLLLWEVSKSFLDIEKELSQAIAVKMKYAED